MQEVNFSELNHLKKKEFFNYLLDNNIQFKEGESNYYAKVVLKPSKQPSINAAPTKSPNANSKVRDSQKGAFKQKEKERPRQDRSSTKQPSKTRINQKHPDRDRQKENKHPLIRLGNRDKEYVLKRPIPQRLSTPTRSHSFLDNRRKELSLSDYSLQMPLNLSDLSVTDKGLKCKTQRSNTSKSPQRTNSIKKDAPQIPQKVFIPKFGGLEQSQARQSDKRVSTGARLEFLISPYLRLFKMSGTVSRSSKLSRHQLDRVIQEIYCASFIKNNTILKTRRFKETMEMESVFASFITEYYEQKYKIKKSAQFNLMSLIHSLVSHIDKNARNLVIFDRFLKEEYNYEDLVFFLFIRNLAEKQIKQTHEKAERKTKEDLEEFRFHLTEREVVKLIKTLVGKDEGLLAEYIELIEEHFKEGFIPIYDVLEILLENYCRKRQNTSTNPHPTPPYSPPNRTSNHLPPRNNFVSKPIEHETYEIPTESDSEELTFGESTIRNRECNNDTFWYQTNQKAEIPSDQLEVIIVQKMDKKISDLIKYILDDDQDFRFTVSQFHGLIFNKARNLIRAVFQMDKLDWFRLLGIREPDIDKLSHIEGLQKMVKTMRKSNESHLANKFCKSILTTEQFLGAIKKIVIG